MKVTAVQNSFVGGELAPALYGRTDLAKYGVGCRTLRNFIVHAHGGASNRGGTKFVGEVKDSSKQVRLIPFVFSITQAYVLEIGNGYMRILKDGEYVRETAKNITDITQSVPTAAIVTCASHGYSADDVVYIDGVSGMVEVNERYFTVGATPGTNTFSIATAATYSAYTSGGTVELLHEETYSTFTEVIAQELKYTQSATDLYLTHPSMNPTKITRGGDDVSWTLGGVTIAPDVDAVTASLVAGGSNSYVVTAIASDGEESNISNAVTASDTGSINWTTHSGDDYYRVYKDEDTNTGFYSWVADVDGTLATWTDATISPDLSVGAPLTQNPFSGANNAPGVCTIFEQRLILARTNNKPQTIWGSQVGHYLNFNESHPVRDSDAYEFTLDSHAMNEILWLAPLESLVVGTSGTEWKLSSGGQSDSITPTNVKARVQSQWGCADIMPLIIGNTLLFVQYGGRVIRDLTYSLEMDGYTGNDLTILAPHLFERYTISQWAYQRNPYSVIWVVRSDGTLCGMTYLREQEVWAWHTHDTTGTYESIACVPSGDGDDDLYVCVNRTIDGSTVRYIEWFPDRLPNGDAEYGYFLDCAKAQDAVTPIDIDAIWQWQYTDTFALGTDQTFSSDGAALYGWWALNTANCDTFDAYVAPDDLLKIVSSNGVTTNWDDATITGPYAYKVYRGDITVYIQHTFASGTETDDAVGVVVQDNTDTNEWLSIALVKTATAYEIEWKNTVNGTSTTDSVAVADATHQYWRVVRSGDTWTLSSSVNGSTWTQRYSVERSDIGTAARIGPAMWCPTTADGGNTTNCFYSSIPAGTQKGPVFITDASHGMSNGTVVYIRDITGDSYMRLLNGNQYTIADVATNTFTLTNSDGTYEDSNHGVWLGGGTYAPDGFRTVRGLDHLEGATVVALKDSVPETGLTVTDGAVTLSSTASVVLVGLPYTCDLETMDFVFRTETGSTVDRHRGVTSVAFHVQESRALQAGPSSDRLNTVAFSELGADTFTGLKEIPVHAGNRKTSRVFIRNTSPLPLTLLSVYPRLHVGED